MHSIKRRSGSEWTANANQESAQDSAKPGTKSTSERQEGSTWQGGVETYRDDPGMERDTTWKEWWQKWIAGCSELQSEELLRLVVWALSFRKQRRTVSLCV